MTLGKSIYRSPGNPGPPEAGVLCWAALRLTAKGPLGPLFHFGACAGRPLADLAPALILGVPCPRPVAQSVPAAARLAGSPGGPGFPLHRLGRQREKRAVGKFQIPAKDLHFVTRLAFAAAPAFDHELGADRETAGKTTSTIHHDILLRCHHP